MGQIGISKESNPSFIGFYDLSRNLLVIRENLSIDNCLYFNIADNDQLQGPYSTADVYSIYNSDPEMRAFELETIGSARVESGMLRGSKLTSKTTLAVFAKASDIEKFIETYIGI